MFLVSLGILVYLITMAGGSYAYGQWAASKVKSRSGAKLSVFFLGIVIFIDDYFNSLTVGTVMRPITDKFKISRAKLAYIIDSTAAPICIIAPVSSWVVTVMSTMGDKFKTTGIAMEPFTAFLMTIPYNYYAWLTLLMVVILCLYKFDFGSMRLHEEKALRDGDVGGLAFDENDVSQESSGKGSMWDLVLPISGLVLFSLMAMVYTGGYFEGGMSVLDAIKDTDAATSYYMGE
ncbi:hypothetical protein N752_02155 [Desulforamulus aquiferis]|nr:hypothetical protein N752_02155 [Desulforamulus aquiferis]